MSQFQKLTFEQKRIKAWRTKRNALVCKLLRENRWMTREDALQRANAALKFPK